jgi:predicted RNA-binding protein with RPS1 domain
MDCFCQSVTPTFALSQKSNRLTISMSTGDNAASPADENQASATSTTQESSSADQVTEPSSPAESSTPQTVSRETVSPQPSPETVSPETVSSPEMGAESLRAAAESSASTSDESAEQDSSDASSSGPLSKLSRRSGPLAARGQGVAKPASPAVDPQKLAEAGEAKSEKRSEKAAQPKKPKHPRPRLPGDQPAASRGAEKTPVTAKRIAIPNLRDSLSDDLQAELEAELADADVESMLGGSAGMSERGEPLEDGQSVQGQVLKIHEDNVFVSLGGPDEGVVPFVQFQQEPSIGMAIEVIVRGISREDGLYALSLPGSAIEVNDWDDLDEGSVVEAVVTGCNTGGLECKAGGVKGFIPISQISEYRVEDTSEFVDQRFLCVITEANASRGNLVLSRRAVLEREREEKRKEQLEKIEVGDEIEGIVRSVKDFGAFVDLGGLDGLIHISKLSWDRVKHPSEVLEVGQKVKVIIDKIDKDAAKISLSYRDLLDNPWDLAEEEFTIGSIHAGTVTRIATFGCFVKLTAGVEGLVHISELAHHRVSRVDSVVSEGQQIEVKVLSFDRDSQKMGLSIKAAQQPTDDSAKPAGDSETVEPPREVAVKATHSGPLKGGNNRDAGGDRFGLRW